MMGKVLIITFLWLFSTVALSQERFALLIGNSNYLAAPLKNPINDALAMEGALQRLGFKTKTYYDVSLNAGLFNAN